MPTSLLTAIQPHAQKLPPPGRILGLVLLMIMLAGLPAAALNELFPLAPPDTISPRNTLAYFLLNMNRGYRIQLNEGFASPEARKHIKKATRSLDLNKVAPVDLRDVSFETALLLKEVLDRLDLPPADQIPDAETMAAGNMAAWTIPNTEITIARIEEGPDKGRFLFSSETVARIRDFYERIQELPYQAGASVGIYEDFIFSPGPMIPNRVINALPRWAQAGIYEQAVWQWISAAILLCAGGLIIITVFRWSRTDAQGDTRPAGRFSWQRYLPPLTMVVVTAFLRYFIDVQINLTGAVAEYFARVMRVLTIANVAWLILLTGEGFTEIIISSPRLRPRHIDPNLTRLICKLFTWILLFLFIWNVSAYLGVSFTAVFASAGIAGVALALAARETLGNFFGGISILMDRPFKTGDYILLESGERGMVVNVGMRSTRILTRDDIQIAIPNGIITNTKVINESAPQPRFRIRIRVGVAYGSDIDLVEQTLLDVAQDNQLVSPSPEPRVRFRAFGDSALDFELLCWARRPHDKGRLIHELNQTIYKGFEAEGIQIPFPQRDVHLIKKA
jgi:MscS family membrane protein